MSGICIPGAKIPDGDYVRVLMLHKDGTCVDGIGNVFKVIPIPPHGRLIDADALLMRINHEGMEAYMDGACYGVHPSQEYLYLLGEIIDDASTVIPASEEGE